MNRRDFLKFTTLSAPVFLPLSLLPEQQAAPKKQREYTNHLGIMVWTRDFMDYALGHRPIEEITEDEVERILLGWGFPGDIVVVKIHQELKDIPFGRIRILVSQKDLYFAHEGDEIMIVSPQLYIENGITKFRGWHL